MMAASDGHRPTWWGLGRILVVGAAGALLAAGVHPPEVALPGVEVTAPSAAVADLSQDSRLVCPGIEVRGLSGAPDLTVRGTLAAALPPEQVLGGQNAQLSVSDGNRAVATGKAGQPISTPLLGVAPASVSGQGGSSAGLSARQAWLVDDRGLRGLASVRCQEPSADVWLLAGGAGVGRQERLVVANPGANAVAVSIDVHGKAGALPAASTRVTIPPGERVVRLLDALAPGEASPAVHVRAADGVIVATLTEVSTSGTSSGGVDTVAVSPVAATRVVIPGVSVGAGSVVRVVAPGQRPAVASVSVAGPQGLVALRGGSVLTVPAGGSVDLPLSGLAAGTYSVEVTADVPIIASALGRLVRSPDADLAWASSALPVSGVSGVTLTGAGKASVALRAQSSVVSVTLWTVVAGVATPRELRVPADRVTLIPVTGASVWLEVPSGSAVQGSVIEADANAPLLTSTPFVSALEAGGSMTAVPAGP